MVFQITGKDSNAAPSLMAETKTWIAMGNQSAFSPQSCTSAF